MDLNKKPNNEEDKVYKEVVLQIREALKEDLFDSEQGFDKEKQNEVIRILKDNFDTSYEAMGKICMENTMMFNRDTGDILDYGVPFFMCPLWLAYGYRLIIPNNCFPTYNIKNKYMGYWDGNKFYKTPSRIEAFIKSDRLGFLIMTGLFIYMVLYLIYHGFTGK